MKKLIKLDYRDYIVPDDLEVGTVVNILSSLTKVERNGYGEEAVFVPKKDSWMTIEIEVVQDDQVRDLTPEEKESKEIKELKNSLSYNKSLVESRDKEIERLECKLKLLNINENKEEV